MGIDSTKFSYISNILLFGVKLWFSNSPFLLTGADDLF